MSGCEKGTSNIINERNGGYERVMEYVPIGQPNSSTLAKLQALQASEESGDRTLAGFLCCFSLLWLTVRENYRQQLTRLLWLSRRRMII